MASYDDTHTISIPSNGGSLYSYGGVILDEEDISNVDTIEYNRSHLPSVPISAVLQEGTLAHISPDNQFTISGIDENNPYYVKSIEGFESSRNIVCKSLSTGAIFIQQYSRSSEEVTIELHIDGEVLEESGTYSPNCVRYHLLPDELVCKQVGVNSEIISELI